MFIDPYEYKHIKASQIKDLMEKGKGASEVLLWLPTQQMYRFQNDAPVALQDFIEEIVPYKEWKSTDNVYSFIEQLKKGFQELLGNDFFVDSFSIKKDKSTVYCLYFFTSHIRGFEKMLETKWDIDFENGRGWDFSGNRPTLFGDELQTNELEEKLKTFFNHGEKFNWQVYEFTIRHGFLPKHAREILIEWQNIGKLEVKLFNGRPAPKKSFYLSYEYWKNDRQKVSIKLK